MRKKMHNSQLFPLVTSFLLGDSNVAKVPLRGVGFPSCHVNEMARIAKSIPIPYYCTFGILCFSVSHLRATINENSLRNLASEYRALMQELRGRFGHYLIIGARPNTPDQISNIRWVSRQLEIEFATDDSVTVVDIFKHPQMLEAAQGTKGRVSASGYNGAHKIGGIIHYSLKEARHLVEVIDETIYSTKPEHIMKRPIRAKRCKKKLIHNHPFTITKKLIKPNICPYTLSLYRKYGDKFFFIPQEESNNH